jgi:hypothetical protein
MPTAWAKARELVLVLEQLAKGVDLNWLLDYIMLAPAARGQTRVCCNRKEEDPVTGPAR